jgi:hypothetical protein
MKAKLLLILTVAFILGSFSIHCHAESTDNDKKREILKKMEGLPWNLKFIRADGKISSGKRKIQFFLKDKYLVVRDFRGKKSASSEIPLQEIILSEEELVFCYRLIDHIKQLTIHVSWEGGIRGTKSTLFGGIWIDVEFFR